MNWDDAYTNSAYIPDGDSYVDRWQEAAAAYRDRMLALDRARLDIAYGSGPRHALDLFLPDSTPKGLAIFIHGGYWLRFDKSMWSHLAEGAVSAGWAVAMPSYSLAPDVNVAAITAEVGQAIEKAASMVPGPIRLAGHSAGGHLATRMVCSDTPLSTATQRRIGAVLSISGLHDLRPLLNTAMGPKLFRNPAEAAAESPALGQPLPGTTITCWVGDQERPEFLRQNDLLANIWFGLGAQTRSIHQPHRHHFNIIEGLTEPQSALTAAFIA